LESRGVEGVALGAAEAAALLLHGVPEQRHHLLAVVDLWVKHGEALEAPKVGGVGSQRRRLRRIGEHVAEDEAAHAGDALGTREGYEGNAQLLSLDGCSRRFAREDRANDDLDSLGGKLFDG